MSDPYASNGPFAGFRTDGNRSGGGPDGGGAVLIVVPVPDGGNGGAGGGGQAYPGSLGVNGPVEYWRARCLRAEAALVEVTEELRRLNALLAERA